MSTEQRTKELTKSAHLSMVTRGISPHSFCMPKRTRKLIMRWIIERKRMIEQGEIW